jgi:hypothetical protein
LLALDGEQFAANFVEVFLQLQMMVFLQLQMMDVIAHGDICCGQRTRLLL